jgi:hypothetical protein
VQVLDAAVNLTTRQPVFLLKLRAITARDDSADRKLDPVFVLFRLLFCGGSSYRFTIRSSANPSGA